MLMPAPTIGRIDVHSHLLPGMDDGCQSIEESIACAKRLVEAGYTHSFCTPHIWPSLPGNTTTQIAERVQRMQELLDEADVSLKLSPGGEMNLRPDFTRSSNETVVTYGMAGKFALIDLWAERLPEFFEPSIRWLQSKQITVILAHPERMRAVQDEPSLADRFAKMGVLLQGNLQCFGDPPTASTRKIAERFLAEGRYFMLGSDLHNLATLPLRMNGLARAIQIIGEKGAFVLTRDNPLKLLGL